MAWFSRAAASTVLLVAAGCGPGPAYSAQDEVQGPEPAAISPPSAPLSQRSSADDFGDPPWVSEKLPLVRAMGIDPAADLETRGAYHWRWRAKRELTVGNYRCPSGSAVDASRHMLGVTPAEQGACESGAHSGVQMLKVHPDGQVEPIG